MAAPLAAYAAGVTATSPLYAYTLDMVEGLDDSLETHAITAQACGIIAVTEGLTTEDAGGEVADAGTGEWRVRAPGL